MDRPVRWTRSAEADLNSIAAYIAQDSANYAAEFVAGVLALADTLAEFPGRGHVVPELGDEAVRELSYKGWRLLYEAFEDAVYVHALIHGARDLDAVWRGREG